MKKKEQNIKKIFKLIFIFSIILFVGYFAYQFFCSEQEKKELENKINEIEESRDDNQINENTEKNDTENKNESTVTEEIPRTLKGYSVIAKLEVPKIDLKTYVLSKTTNSSLNVSVTKFWGSEPNEVGNFCIAGHNSNRTTMFKNLKKLSKGDEIILIDMNKKKVSYEVYDIYTVDPYDRDCLSQKTNGKKEVTLITCTIDGKTRIIIKAMEK